LAAGNNLEFLDFSDGRTLIAAAGFLSQGGIQIVASDIDADYRVGFKENILDRRTCSKEEKLSIDLGIGIRLAVIVGATSKVNFVQLHL